MFTEAVDAVVGSGGKSGAGGEWLSVHAFAKQLNMSAPVAQALLGSLPVRYRGDREDIGLRLFIQRGKAGSHTAASLCCLGFSRLERNEWQFSRKAVAIMQEYCALAPRLPERLNDIFRRSSSGVPASKDLFDGDADKQFMGVVDFVKKKVKSLPHVPVGHEALDDVQVGLLEDQLRQSASDSQRSRPTLAASNSSRGTSFSRSFR